MELLGTTSDMLRRSKETPSESVHSLSCARRLGTSTVCTVVLSFLAALDVVFERIMMARTSISMYETTSGDADGFLVGSASASASAGSVHVAAGVCAGASEGAEHGAPMACVQCMECIGCAGCGGTTMRNTTVNVVVPEVSMWAVGQ